MAPRIGCVTEAALEALRRRERAVEGWIEALTKRRAALARRYQSFADPDDLTGVPDGLARELRTLIESLVDDLDAQIDDLEGDLETLRKLRSTLSSATGEVRDELVTYAEDLDDALGQKGRSIEGLVGTADQLIERFDRIIEAPDDRD